DSYRTDVKIANSSEGAISGTLYRAGDCELSGSDSGYGQVNSGAVACSDGTGSGARLLEWTPITGGSHYSEGSYFSVWGQVSSAGANFPDSCTCSTAQDNGSGLSWSFNAPAGSDQTFSQTLT